MAKNSTTFTPPPPRNGFGVSFNVPSEAASSSSDKQGCNADASASASADAAVEAERSAQRSAAFEKFTNEHALGVELGGILSENRKSLKAKKRAAKELSIKVNDLKKGIDAARRQMDALKAASEADGDAGNEDAYNSQLIAMRDLKGEYRACYEELKMVKSEVDYTNKLVESTARQLVMEFNNWHCSANGAQSEGRVATKVSLESSQLSAGSGASSPSSSGSPVKGGHRGACVHTDSTPDGADVSGERQQPRVRTRQEATESSSSRPVGASASGSEAYLNAQRAASTNASRQQQQQQRLINQRRNMQRSTFG